MRHFVNGEIAAAEDIQVSPFDHGFLYGMGLFETFRTYGGHPFLLDDHFSRLHSSAEKMNILLPPYNRGRAQEIIRRLLAENGLEDAYFRWNISAGAHGVGLPVSPYRDPNEFVFVKELPEYIPEEKQAVTLALPRNRPETGVRLKSHHYFNNIAGKWELGSDQTKEGIFLTEDGSVSEGIVSNIFWLKGKTVYTPDLSCGCLPGTIRSFVIRAAEYNGLEVAAGRFPPEHAARAEEVWLTNAIQQIVPLTHWDGVPFPGRNGKVYQYLSRVYDHYRKVFYSVYDWQKSDFTS